MLFKLRHSCYNERSLEDLENYEFIPENLKDNELKINEQINERISKLTFADDFIFYSVLAGDSDICKAVIESCIGKPIDRIVYTNGQEAMKLMAEGKGIRLDVYAKDADHTLYDIEMQTVKGAKQDVMKVLKRVLRKVSW